MKRIILFFIILLICSQALGCKKTFHNEPADTIDLIKIPDPSSLTNNLSHIPQLKLAYEGRMDNTMPIIGENVEQYLNDNYEMYHFLGGLAYKNKDMKLLTNGYLEDNKPVYGDVLAIIKDEAYGIKTGTSMNEVILALGEPYKVIDYNQVCDVSDIYGKNIIFIYSVGDYKVVIVFDSSSRNVVAVHLDGINNNLGYPSYVKKIDLLDLSQEELEAYNNFQSTYNEEVLRGLEPISIMKLYLHAGIIKDYETEWELYSKKENQLGWDKEYHMSINDADRLRDYRIFENAVNIRSTFDSDDLYASISFEDKYLEEYDNDGYPFRFGFSLVMNEDGVWKVAFMPMQ